MSDAMEDLPLTTGSQEVPLGNEPPVLTVEPVRKSGEATAPAIVSVPGPSGRVNKPLNKPHSYSLRSGKPHQPTPSSRMPGNQVEHV